MSVAVVLEIRLVVTLVVRHEVAQREAVMCRDEVHAGRRLASVAAKQVAGTREPFRETAEHSSSAVPERAHRVAVAVVPLAPAGRKVAELIAAEAEIPGLRD